MTSGHDTVPVVDRVGGRVLVVDAADRVLLLHGSDPANRAAGSWWMTPGGGADPGETIEQTARRELEEETGLRLDRLGPPVWVRTAEFSFLGRDYRQAETFFLVRVDRHDVDSTGWTDIERETVHETRWWDLDALEASDETVYPSRLVPELRRLLVEGPPASPRQVGS